MDAGLVNENIDLGSLDGGVVGLKNGDDPVPVAGNKLGDGLAGKGLFFSGVVDWVGEVLKGFRVELVSELGKMD